MGLLAGESGGKAAAELARGVVRLQPTAEDEDQTRAVLLRLLTDQTDGRVAAELTRGLVQLNLTSEDEDQVPVKRRSGC